VRGALPAATYYADPAAGSPDGDGSAERPWRTLEEVVRARRLASGDTLLLRSGYHGNVSLSGANDETITIAAEKGHSPRLGRLVLTEGRNWQFKGLAISPSCGGGPYRGDMVILGEGGPSSDIVLEDCFVYTALDSSGWSARDWMEANNGIFSGRHGTRITLRNNYVLNTRFGVSLSSPDSLCEANVVCGFSGDGIRVTRDGITVQYNVIKDVFVGSAHGDDNHDDGIQCFLFNKGRGTVRRVTVRGNIIIDREEEGRPFATGMQGIGFFDGPLVEFLVEKNVVLVSHWHGISLYDAQGCRILDNACYSKWPGPSRPWIMLGTKRDVGGSRGNTVRNNMAHSFDLRADPEVTEEGNVPVKEEVFYQRMRELEAFINGKFGRFHPVAKYSRLGKEKASEAPPRPRAVAVLARPQAASDQAPPPPGEELVARLRRAVIEGTRAGEHRSVHVDARGAVERGTVVAADDEVVRIRLDGVEIDVKWTSLSPLRFYGIVSKYSKDREALSAYARATGLVEPTGGE